MVALLSLLSSAGTLLTRRAGPGFIPPDTNDIVECYAIPYGFPGFIGNLVNLYILNCVSRRRTPLSPSRPLRHWNLDLFLSAAQLLSCWVLITHTYLQCRPRHRNDLTLILASIFIFTLIVTFPLFRVAARRGERHVEYIDVSTPGEQELDSLAEKNGHRRAAHPSKTTSDHAPQDEESAPPKTADAHPPSWPSDPIYGAPTDCRTLLTHFTILAPTVYVMAGTYLVLKTPAVDQSSFEAKTAWVLLFLVYTVSALILGLSCFYPIYDRCQAEGWRGLRAMTLVEVLGYWPRIFAGRIVLTRARSTVWLSLTYGGMAATFFSNLVLALAAGRNAGFPEVVEGREGLVRTYWIYFVLSKVTLLSV